MNWKRVREKVLEQNYPDQKELDEAHKLYNKVSNYIKKEFGLKTHFAGSTSRKTCMAGDKDLDIFVLFPEDTDRKELEQKGLTVGKKVFENFDGDYKVDYAEHPYTKGVLKGHEVEVVPCFDVSPENLRSAVDRTPHHSKWAAENLLEEERRDVVVLKKFLDAGGLYGSSLKVRGFSGYLCEVLISHYGGFKSLAEAAKEWGEDQVIDPERHHEGGLPQRLKEKFSDEALVVVDPVDPERNVASVLSVENYSKTIHRFWEFNKNPSMKFFQEEETEVTEFEVQQEIDKRADTIVMQFDTPEGVEDVLYPQMRKTMRRIRQALKNEGFRVFESGFHVGKEKTRIILELEASLPEIKEMKGPKLFHGVEHIEQFTKKYENTFIKDERLYAKTEREYTEAKAFLNSFLTGEPDELAEKGIPERIAEKAKDFRFVNPVQEDEEWLKYLVEKLNIDQK
ncbi:MAG: CCA tRNA nucleotidyltransferase [Candidatus Nanohalobium sp.]